MPKKRKTRKHTGSGDRDQSVREEMSDWKPGFDHPGRSLPDHVLENITEHLEAQEEAEVKPRYRFPYPPRILKQTMDKVEGPPPLAYPPPPEMSEEQINNMIIQHYTGIPDSGKLLPMHFSVMENDPETGTPFKVTYDDAGRNQFIHLKIVGDVARWDESWFQSKFVHQSFKLPRPAPVLYDARSRIYGPDAPAYDDRRGDILVAIDPFSTRNDKVIAEIGEVIRCPMSCNPGYNTTHCFKIFFNTPEELDFTSGQPAGERRRPYELTLPPHTIIRVIRGRKIDYPPITPRETFRTPPKGGKKKKRKTRRKRKKQRGGVPLSTSQYNRPGAGSAVEMSRATNYFSDIINQNQGLSTSMFPKENDFVSYVIPKMYPFNYNWWGQNLGVYLGGGKKRKTRKRKSRKN